MSRFDLYAVVILNVIKLSVVILNVIMLSIVILNVIKLSVVILNVIMLTVVILSDVVLQLSLLLVAICCKKPIIRKILVRFTFILNKFFAPFSLFHYQWRQLDSNPRPWDD